MAGDVSFDVVSDFEEQELRNALDQVRREVAQRYDFKGATVEISQGKTELVEPGDVVLVMGGGRSYVVAERLVELLRRADPAATSSVSDAASPET